jgi:hypothetical protein
VENFVSLVATRCRQGPIVGEWLTECCQAYFCGDQPPSLLPQSRGNGVPMNRTLRLRRLSDDERQQLKVGLCWVEALTR